MTAGTNGNRMLRSLRELYSVLFTPDFTIDERPVEIPDGLTSTMETSVGELKGANAATRDVMSLVSAMMRREEKARLEAEAMRNRPDEDQEMFPMMKQILQVLDGFDHVLGAARGMERAPELTNWLKSVEMLYFRFVKVLERFGLVPLRSIGQVVNLDYHDVVEYRPTSHHPADTVIAERQKGWAFRNRLLREAKVVVARPTRSN